jgi:hypothetical protein
MAHPNEQKLEEISKLTSNMPATPEELTSLITKVNSLANSRLQETEATKEVNDVDDTSKKALQAYKERTNMLTHAPQGSVTPVVPDVDFGSVLKTPR